MNGPIVVRTTKKVRDYARGSELGFASVAKAEQVLGEGAFTIVRYQDGSDYDAPKPAPQEAADAETEAKSDRKRRGHS